MEEITDKHSDINEADLIIRDLKKSPNRNWFPD